MNKDFGKILKSKIAKNAPGLCVALGLGSLVFATIVAVYETPKALKAIEELDDISEETDDEEVTESETQTEEKETEEIKISKINRAVAITKATWKFYIPSAISMGVGIFLVLKSHSMMKNRLAALTVAYTGVDTAYKLYKKNAVDILGDKKEQEIQDAVAKDRLESSTPTEAPIETGRGMTYCYDSFSDRYFYSDIETIRRAVNDMNRQLLDDAFVSINELYYEIGLGSVEYGDDLGWRIADGLIDVHFSSQLSYNGEPCLVVQFDARPAHVNTNLYY